MWSDLVARLKDRRRLAAAAAVAVLAGLVGPFGTYTADGLAARMLFWPAVVATAVPVALVCRVAIDRALAGRGFWARALAVSLAFGLLYTPVLYGLVHLRVGAGRDAGMNPAEMAAAVFLVTLLVNAIARILRSGRDRLPSTALARAAEAVPAVAGTAAAPQTGLAGFAADPPPGLPAPAGLPAALPGPAAAAVTPLPLPAPDPPLPRLAARLPDDLRGDILHVTARDHYVVVRTDRGTAEILLRFGDALAELDAADGLRVHRSHWVARRAVGGVERHGDRVVLRLSDGSGVPVSRRSRGALAALGPGPAGEGPGQAA